MVEFLYFITNRTTSVSIWGK